MNQQPITTIDQYISMYPKDVQERLIKIRKLVHDIAPDAEETISYQMPAFKVNGKGLVYFAAFKKHIGFYPFPSGIEAFKKETSEFKTAKGSIQFPLDKPLPLDLIKKIVKYRVQENKSNIKNYK